MVVVPQSANSVNITDTLTFSLPHVFMKRFFTYITNGVIGRDTEIRWNFTGIASKYDANFLQSEVIC
jgi:hypothetical protein